MRHPHITHARAIFLAAVAVMSTHCSSTAETPPGAIISPGSPESPPPANTSASPQADVPPPPGLPSSALIGAKGGSIGLAAASVEFPPNALPIRTQVSLSVVNAASLPEGPGDIAACGSPLLSIAPGNLLLDKAATVTVPCRCEGSDVLALHLINGLRWYPHARSACKGGVARFPTEIASTFAIVSDVPQTTKMLQAFGAPTGVPDGQAIPEYNSANDAVYFDIGSTQRDGGAQLLDAMLAAGATVYMRVPRDFSSLQKAALRMSRNATPNNLKFILADNPGDNPWKRDSGPYSIEGAGTGGRMRMSRFKYFRKTVGDTSDFAKSLDRELKADDSLTFEGGNLEITADGLCMVTSVPIAMHGVAADTLRAKLKAAVGCVQTLIIPLNPAESFTGHIDMFLKVLSSDTILISNALPQAVALLEAKLGKKSTEACLSGADDFTNVGEDDTRYNLCVAIRKTKEADAYLDTLASAFEAKELSEKKALFEKVYSFFRGITLAEVAAIRASNPMPTFRVLRAYNPLALTSDVQVSGGYQPVYRTYTNALLLKGRALVPQYVKNFNGAPYEDDEFRSTYESSATAAYAAAGYTPVFVPMDKFIAMQGAVHCITKNFIDGCAGANTVWNEEKSACSLPSLESRCTEDKVVAGCKIPPSTYSDASVKSVFCLDNKTDGPITLNWVDYEGKFATSTVYEKGKGGCWSTVDTHGFVVHSGDQCLGNFRATHPASSFYSRFEVTAAPLKLEDKIKCAP